MKESKKFLSLALALVLVLALMPTAALAAEYTVTEVVPCKYHFAYSFSEGLATVAVMVDQNYGTCKWGFINKTGKEIIPCKYDSANSFSEGLARVSLNGKYGFIDKTGKEVISLKYDSAGSFSEGLARVGISTGEKTVWGYPVLKYGYIDKTGKEVIPCKYERVGDFSEGLAMVGISTGEKDDWGGPILKCGYIDITGKEVIPCQYAQGVDYNGAFSEGLAAVVKDGKYGYIDKTGKEVIPCKYDYAYSFSEGLAMVMLDEKAGCVDKTGRVVIPLQYEPAEGSLDFHEDLATIAVEVEDSYGQPSRKWGFIDKTGKEFVPCKYDSADSFSEGLARVSLNGKSSYIDKKGKEVISCNGGAYSFSEGFAMVQLNGKLGFISVTKNAAPATQTVNVDGKNVEFAMYALGGGSTNYIRVRDLAAILNGTKAQFEVGWSGSVTLTSKTAYTGGTGKAPFNTEMAYTDYTAPTYVDGKAVDLAAIQIAYNGGGFTYYKLRDLGKALGFNVGWSADKGIFVETDKPYDPKN